MDEVLTRKSEPRAVISQVFSGSLGEELGLVPGDIIYQVNGIPVRDLIDFEFQWAGDEATLLLQRKSEKGREEITIEKDYDEPLGVEFASGVFDGVRHCKNKCLFCFVDQMPQGLRSSLYEKDDDYRLSFLQGNFVTLTNLTRDDKERIKRLHLSPLYVSVQAAEGEVRRKLLKNPCSARIMEDLQELTEAGISFHTQIVLCKGINDKEHFYESVRMLDRLGEHILSLAVVPAGITRFRKNPEDFPPFTEDEARVLIEWVGNYQKEAQVRRGTRFLYASDEWYIKGKMPFPEAEAYEGFPQLENGVGLCRLFLDDFYENEEELPVSMEYPVEIYAISGKSPESFLMQVVDRLNQITNLKVTLLPLENKFFGERVTVTGLLTGSDLVEGLRHLPAGARVLVPDILFKKGETLFLDDLTLQDVENIRNLCLLPFNSTFSGLWEKIEQEEKRNEA